MPISVESFYSDEFVRMIENKTQVHYATIEAFLEGRWFCGLSVIDGTWIEFGKPNP